MFNLDHTPGRTAIVDGKEYLFFSGYSYLGMNHVPEFIELIKEGMDKYGLLFPSSRISNTQLNLFSEFENMLSDITGMEETVCFSSGFLAGRAVVDLFRHNHISCAPQSHPAICLEKTFASSFSDWKNNIGNVQVILFDSVNPLTAEVNNIDFLINKNFTAIIDDSHGAGILNGGKGIGKNLPEEIDSIIIFSLSKAYNMIGGVVSCSTEIALQLRNSPYYTASTSIAPAFAYAFIKGQHLYHQQREKLQMNIELFRSLTNNRFKSHPELPIFILPEHVNEKNLEEAGIIISSFAYPDPAGEKIKRIVLNALHTGDDLQRLANALH